MDEVVEKVAHFDHYARDGVFSSPSFVPGFPSRTDLQIRGRVESVYGYLGEYRELQHTACPIGCSECCVFRLGYFPAQSVCLTLEAFKSEMLLP